jgi:hypothetical protein
VNLIKTVHRALLQNHVIGRQSSKSLSYWSAAAAVVGANCDEKGGWLFMGNGAWGNVGMRPDRNEIKNYHDNVFKKKNPPGLPPTKKKTKKNKNQQTTNKRTNWLTNNSETCARQNSEVSLTVWAKTSCGSCQARVNLVNGQRGSGTPHQTHRPAS